MKIERMRTPLAGVGYISAARESDSFASREPSNSQIDAADESTDRERRRPFYRPPDPKPEKREALRADGSGIVASADEVHSLDITA